MNYLNKFLIIRSFSNHTIFSKSSGTGKCGVAVIRVSGSETKAALRSLTGSDSYKPRYATLKKLKDPQNKFLIDTGLVIFFESPKSFTGEDSAEFQVHGGNAVVSAVLSALSKVPGLRPAEPGEFTKRAFFNGKLDLTEVEGLADLIHAETEFQRRQAVIQADGHLSKLYKKWRTQLIRNIAHVEAWIDFSEDENIEDGVLEAMRGDLERLVEEIDEHLRDGRRGERMREGVKIVIAGDTNVGKSSLMNKLVQRDVSIVTAVEGTTRDVIESVVDISGYPAVISDTAGIRESSDEVEAEGISRARKCVTFADLVVLLLDGERLEKSSVKDFRVYQNLYIEQLGIAAELKDKKLIAVVNKVDLMSESCRKNLEAQDVLTISCKNSENIKKFLEEITNSLEELCGDPNCESPVLSQTRHRFFVQDCGRQLREFLENFDPNCEQDFAILVQHLRNAVRSIGKITGEVRTDDVLDVIFRDFCIGK